MEEQKKDIVEEKKVEDQTVVEDAENPMHINWKNFRAAREKERQQTIAAQQRATELEKQTVAMKQAMEALTARPQSETTEEDDIDRKIKHALAQQQRQIEESNRIREARELPEKIKSIFPDFDQVCSQENMDYMDFHYPEISSAIEDMPEGLKKYSTIYRTAKRFIPNTNIKKEGIKADQNLAKPQSISKAGSSVPAADIRRNLDDATKAANWARMQSVMRGGG